MSKNKSSKSTSRKQVEPEQTLPYDTLKEASSKSTDQTIFFVREIVETFAIAFVLAFLFKTFEGELFVIPTGSMAPTLMGRHKDFACPECGYEYRVSASDEFNAGTNEKLDSMVVGGTCPQCRYTAYIGPHNSQNQKYPSCRGDNILVNKYIVDFREPHRWDVTVFRYPGSPHISFIKRIVGLEKEALQIHNGNVYIKKENESDFQIARKEPYQLISMLQDVYNNDYCLSEQYKIGVPTRWHTHQMLSVISSKYGRDSSNDEKLVDTPIYHQNSKNTGYGESWQTEDNKKFVSTATEFFSWLNYRHCPLSSLDWQHIKEGGFNPTEHHIPAQLIADFTAYNTGTSFSTSTSTGINKIDITDTITEQAFRRAEHGFGIGANWVRDLAIECDLTVQKPQGQIVFELVRGGVAFNCTLEPENGTATLSIPNFDVADFEPVQTEIPVRGAGTWHILFANVDDELRLFVDSKEIQFSKKATYKLPADQPPTALDLTPVSIGVKNAAIEVDHLNIKRDIYYIATSGRNQTDDNSLCDTEALTNGTNVRVAESTINVWEEENLRQRMADLSFFPKYGKTRTFETTLNKDAFFALGDNTAQSSDSRRWQNEGSNPSPIGYVPREYLIGKAIFVHWPHGKPIPGTNINIIPNISRMRFIE